MANESIDYCSFCSSACNKIIPPYNEMKVFFAYPSEPRIKGYIADLFEEQQLKGLTLSNWEDLSDSGGIIFCKVCSEILTSRAFVADITFLNQNVLFELGYSLAKRKVPILIREQQRQGKIIDMLSDVKRIEYSDLSALAGKIYEAIFDDFPFSELEHVQVSDDPGIFFVNADANMPVKRSIFEYLETFSKDFLLKTLVDDSSEITSHKLIQLLKNVEQSEIVICHMVGIDYKESDEINAQVSLLAGYALGRQKKLLILQEHPSDKMIDLQQVRKTYKNRVEAMDILEKWIAPIRKERARVADLESRKKEHISIYEQLSEGLGHPAAEYDVNLREYFIRTSEFQEAVKQRKNLFLGRRGAGKTANFLQLEEELRGRVKNIVVTITPSKLQLVSAIDNLNKHVGQTKLTALFEMFWLYIILTEIAISCRNYMKESVRLDESALFKRVEELVSSKSNIDCDFDIRFSELIDNFCESVLKDNPANLRAHILSNFYKEYFPELKKLIFTISETHPITVLIDNLDRDWSSSSKNSISSLINALIEVSERINNFNEFGNCKTIIFLRTDIYRLSSRLDPDYDKRQPSVLRWDETSLKTLVCERIARVKDLECDNLDDIWGSVYGNDLEGIKDSFKYIIERTMYRPRDILTFCTIILEQMNKRKKTVIDEEDVYEAESIFSEYLLRNLRQEYSVGYPNIEDICISLFLGKVGIVCESDLRRRINEYPELTSNCGINDLISFCFDVGILGIKIDNKPRFSYEGYEFERLNAQAKQQGDVTYAIHLGLVKYLDVKD